MATTTEVYEELWQEICRVDSTWLMYRALFSKDAVQVLNGAEYLREVFRRVQDSLGDSIFLRLWALRDPDSDSLTFRKLFNKLGVSSGLTRTTIEDLLTRYEQATDGIEHHRHKRIAHTDIKVATGSESIPEIPVAEITEAFKVAEALMHEMQPLVPDKVEKVTVLRDDFYTIGQHARDVIARLEERS